MTTVLIADPDPRTRKLTGAALRLAGYTVESTGALARAGSLVRRRRPDALILDPTDTAPVEILSALRAQTEIPIIVVSSTTDDWDKIALLDAGADDYLAKPFGVEELLARLRVSLRRASATGTDESAIMTPDFTVHLRDRRWLRKDDTEVRLTPLEWRLVEMLVRRAGHLVTQAELLRGAWGPSAAEKTHYLRIQMAAIRRKVEPDPGRPKYFITAPGLGLRFDPNAGDRLRPC
jgi:two-component system KDP operon response regulator KdpE